MAIEGDEGHGERQLLSMDEPEELAAAFFAQQAAKEKARITLPIDDWTRAIIAMAAEREVKKENSNDDAQIDSSSSCQMSILSTNTPATTAWLVTTMPPAPTYRLANNEDEDVDGDRCGTRNKGIVGIILSSNETRLLLTTTSDPKFTATTPKVQK